MAETWVLNSTITGNGNFTADFTSNGESFYSIAVSSSITSYGKKMGGNLIVYAKGSGWNNEAYRTIVFDTSPSGNLLTWLQANGTKQGDSEPDTPTPSGHICLIDGTRYSIKGGKTLISGTEYGIKNGKTLIDGVGYNISLSKELSVDMQGSFVYTTVSIGGVSYTSAGVVKAEPNTRVTVTVSGSTAAITNSAIYYNGSKVATGQKKGYQIIPATYSFILKSDTIIRGTDYGGGRTGYAVATITT